MWQNMGGTACVASRRRAKRTCGLCALRIPNGAHPFSHADKCTAVRPVFRWRFFLRYCPRGNFKGATFSVHTFPCIRTAICADRTAHTGQMQLGATEAVCGRLCCVKLIKVERYGNATRSASMLVLYFRKCYVLKILQYPALRISYYKCYMCVLRYSIFFALLLHAGGIFERLIGSHVLLLVLRCCIRH